MGQKNFASNTYNSFGESPQGVGPGAASGALPADDDGRVRQRGLHHRHPHLQVSPHTSPHHPVRRQGDGPHVSLLPRQPEARHSLHRRGAAVSPAMSRWSVASAPWSSGEATAAPPTASGEAERACAGQVDPLLLQQELDNSTVGLTRHF